MANIGFLSYWGMGRGLATVTLSYVKMLQGKHNVFILKQGENEIKDGFKDVDANITEYPSYRVDPEFFKKWIKTNKLDAVIFNEYNQWDNDPVNLVKVTKNAGAKAYGYLIMERFKPEQTIYYDRIFSPTKTFNKFMRKHKIRNFTYIPFSLDLKEFDEYIHAVLAERDKIIFFHPAGYGGFKERKNTNALIDAFNKLNRDDCELVITTQYDKLALKYGERVKVIRKDLYRDELLEQYFQSDAVVLPSKWETIGIPILESLAIGVPVITSDYPPMNEFINHSYNGLLIKGETTKIDQIEVLSYNVYVDDLKKQLEVFLNIPFEVRITMRKNALKEVAEKYDLEKNKKYLLDFLEEDLKNV